MTTSKNAANKQATSIVPDRSKSRHGWDAEYIYATYVHYKSDLVKAEQLLARDVEMEAKRQRHIEVEVPADYIPTDEQKRRSNPLEILRLIGP